MLCSSKRSCVVLTCTQCILPPVTSYEADSLPIIPLCEQMCLGSCLNRYSTLFLHNYWNPTEMNSNARTHTWMTSLINVISCCSAGVSVSTHGAQMISGLIDKVIIENFKCEDVLLFFFNTVGWMKSPQLCNAQVSVWWLFTKEVFQSAGPHLKVMHNSSFFSSCQHFSALSSTTVMEVWSCVMFRIRWAVWAPHSGSSGLVKFQIMKEFELITIRCECRTGCFLTRH